MPRDPFSDFDFGSIIGGGGSSGGGAPEDRYDFTKLFQAQNVYEDLGLPGDEFLYKLRALDEAERNAREAEARRRQEEEAAAAPAGRIDIPLVTPAIESLVDSGAAETVGQIVPKAGQGLGMLVSRSAQQIAALLQGADYDFLSDTLTGATPGRVIKGQGTALAEAGAVDPLSQVRYGLQTGLNRGINAIDEALGAEPVPESLDSPSFLASDTPEARAEFARRNGNLAGLQAVGEGGADLLLGLAAGAGGNAAAPGWQRSSVAALDPFQGLQTEGLRAALGANQAAVRAASGLGDEGLDAALAAGRRGSALEEGVSALYLPGMVQQATQGVETLATSDDPEARWRAIQDIVFGGGMGAQMAHRLGSRRAGSELPDFSAQELRAAGDFNRAIDASAEARGLGMPEMSPERRALAGLDAAEGLGADQQGAHVLRRQADLIAEALGIPLPGKHAGGQDLIPTEAVEGVRMGEVGAVPAPEAAARGIPDPFGRLRAAEEAGPEAAPVDPIAAARAADRANWLAERGLGGRPPSESPLDDFPQFIPKGPVRTPEEAGQADAWAANPEATVLGPDERPAVAEQRPQERPPAPSLPDPFGRLQRANQESWRNDPRTQALLAQIEAGGMAPPKKGVLKGGFRVSEADMDAARERFRPKPELGPGTPPPREGGRIPQAELDKARADLRELELFDFRGVKAETERLYAKNLKKGMAPEKALTDARQRAAKAAAESEALRADAERSRRWSSMTGEARWNARKSLRAKIDYGSVLPWGEDDARPLRGLLKASPDPAMLRADQELVALAKQLEARGKSIAIEKSDFAQRMGDNGQYEVTSTNQARTSEAHLLAQEEFGRGAEWRKIVAAVKKGDPNDPVYQGLLKDRAVRIEERDAEAEAARTRAADLPEGFSPAEYAAQKRAARDAWFEAQRRRPSDSALAEQKREPAEERDTYEPEDGDASFNPDEFEPRPPAPEPPARPAAPAATEPPARPVGSGRERLDALRAKADEAKARFEQAASAQEEASRRFRSGEGSLDDLEAAEKASRAATADFHRSTQDVLDEARARSDESMVEYPESVREAAKKNVQARERGAKRADAKFEEKSGEQAPLFRGRDMLQQSKSRTTEGREADGPLFTQEADARARAEQESQGKLDLSVGEREKALADTEAMLGERFGSFAKVRRAGDGFEVDFRDGQGRLIVRPVDGFVEVAPGKLRAGREAHGGAAGEILGSHKRIGTDSLIKILKGEGLDTLGHEETHAVLAMGRLGRRETQAVIDEFTRRAQNEPRVEGQTEARGWEEVFADTVGQHIKAAREKRLAETPSWFRKIWRTLTGVGESVRQLVAPTAEGAVRAIESGQVYKRGTLYRKVSAAFDSRLAKTATIDDVEKLAIGYHGTEGDPPPGPGPGMGGKVWVAAVSDPRGEKWAKERAHSYAKGSDYIFRIDFPDEWRAKARENAKKHGTPQEHDLAFDYEDIKKLVRENRVKMISVNEARAELDLSETAGADFMAELAQLYGDAPGDAPRISSENEIDMSEFANREGDVVPPPVAQKPGKPQLKEVRSLDDFVEAALGPDAERASYADSEQFALRRRPAGEEPVETLAREAPDAAARAIRAMTGQDVQPAAVRKTFSERPQQAAAEQARAAGLPERPVEPNTEAATAAGPTRQVQTGVLSGVINSFKPALDHIRSFGEAGRKVAGRLADYQRTWEVTSGRHNSDILRSLREEVGAKWEKSWPRIQQLLEQKEAFSPEQAATPEGRAALRIRQTLDEIHARADQFKVAAKYRSGYFPRIPVGQGWTWWDQVRYLQTKEGLDFEDAAEQVNEHILGDAARAREQGFIGGRPQRNLERARRGGKFDYRKDFKVLTEYVLAADRRISEAMHLGKSHELLREDMKGLRGERYLGLTEMDRTRTVVERMTGLERPSMARKVSNLALGFSAWSRLYRAPITQLGSAAQLGSVVGVRDMVRGLRDTLKDFGKAHEQAVRDGALFTNMSEEWAHSTGSSAVFEKFGPWLRATNKMDAFMRVWSTQSAKYFVPRLLAEANRGGMGSAPKAKMLARLGIQGDFDVNNPQHLSKAAKALSDLTQFRTGAGEIPIYASSPLGRLAFQFQNFGYQYGRFLVNMVQDRNFAVLGRLAILGATLGEGIADLKALSSAYSAEGTSREEEEPSFRGYAGVKRVGKWGDLFSGDPQKALAALTDRSIQNFLQVGGLGIFQAMIDKAADSDNILLDVALGPIAGDVKDIGGPLTQLSSAAFKLDAEGAAKSATNLGKQVAKRIPMPVPPGVPISYPIGAELVREFGSTDSEGRPTVPRHRGWVGRIRDASGYGPSAAEREGAASRPGLLRSKKGVDDQIAEILGERPAGTYEERNKDTRRQTKRANVHLEVLKALRDYGTGDAGMARARKAVRDARGMGVLVPGDEFAGWVREYQDSLAGWKRLRAERQRRAERQERMEGR